MKNCKKIVPKIISIVTIAALMVGIFPTSTLAVNGLDPNYVPKVQQTEEANFDEYEPPVLSDEIKEKQYNIAMAGLLNGDISEVSYDIIDSLLQDKPVRNGVWTQESSRSFLLKLINSSTNENYYINNDGYLKLDTSNVKADADKRERYNFYTAKINELISGDKMVALGINDTYSSLGQYDNTVITMMMENEDFAFMFQSTENGDVIVLNSDNYSDTAEDCPKALLMNKILELYFSEESDFPKTSVDIPDEDPSLALVKYDDPNEPELPKEEVTVNYNRTVITDFDVTLTGILSQEPITVEAVENISDIKPTEKGVWVAENSVTALLTYLNNHCIYTYSVKDDGYLQCDNIMKSNPYLDCESETEIDMVMDIALNSESTIIIGIDDSYLTYADNTISRAFLNKNEYVKSFDDQLTNNRIFLLNSSYFNVNIGYDLAMSDRFVKGILPYQTNFSARNASTYSLNSALGNVISGTTVYAGPSASNFATVGSVSSGEDVIILGQLVGWCMIVYQIGATMTFKTGYVSMNNITNVIGSINEENYASGGLAFANGTLKVKSCFDFASSIESGTIYAGESVTELMNYTESGSRISYIEYSTPSGTKRGYVYKNDISNPAYNTRVARVTSVSCAAYSGPDNSYVKLGGAYFSEFVSIIGDYAGWTFVEYNTNSGRKRGYMNGNDLHHYSNLTVPVFATHQMVVKANVASTVYGGPNSNYANIGSISNQERVSLLTTENGYDYIEYGTANGAKRGYVLTTQLDISSQITLPSISTYANFTKEPYGTSGNGRDLYSYKMGHGPNVLIAAFAQHGWEDAWASDGIELVNIANDVMSGLSVSGSTFVNNWTLYVVPYANPDGIVDGFTNNGPGRCTVSTRIDMNRCWPANFVQNKTSRNYTGVTPLAAPEALALKGFITNKMNPSSQNVVLDIHGWLNQTYGSSEVGAYFNQQFGFKHSNTYGNGYLETWADQQGAKACLVELPMPSSSSSITTGNYAGKLQQAMLNLMSNMTGGPVVEGGTTVNELVQVVTTSSVRLRSGPGTSYGIVASLTNGTVVTRVKKAVANANGYSWDKVILNDGTPGYMATNYLAYIESMPSYEKYKIYDEIQAVKAYLRYETPYGNDMAINKQFNNELIGQLTEYQKAKGLSVQDGSLNAATLTSMGFAVDSVGKIIEDGFYQRYITIGNIFSNESERIVEYDKIEDLLAARTYEFGLSYSMSDKSYYDKVALEESLYNSMTDKDKSENKPRLDENQRILRNTCEKFKNIPALKEAYQAINRYMDNTGVNFEFESIRSLFNVSLMDRKKTQFIRETMFVAEKFTKNIDTCKFALKTDQDAQVYWSDPLNVFNSGNWFLACNYFKLANNATATKTGESYQMVLELTEKDYYYWDNDNSPWPVLDGLIPTTILEKDVRELQLAGMARNYETLGSCKYLVEWDKGETVSEARISEI